MVRRLGVAALAMGVLLTVGVVPAVRSQEPFAPGSVTGRAQSFRLGGFTGGTQFTLTLGIALARAQGKQGNAQAQAIEPGIFGLILSSENECTGEPVFPTEFLPRPLRTNSVGGATSATNDVADGEIVRGSSEHVEADPSPFARALTEIANVFLDPVMRVDGLISTADASISVDDRTRVSGGRTSVGTIEIAGGIVRLEGLRWDVRRRTGTDAADDGSFSIGRIVVADTPLQTESPTELALAIDTVNGVLEPFGIGLDVPRVRDQQDGTLAVTSLEVRVGGSEAANPLLGPLLAALQPVRDTLFDLSQQGSCPVDIGVINGALTVVDVVLAALSGAGGLVVEVGGVRSTHDTAFFESPFGALPAADANEPRAGPPSTAAAPRAVPEPDDGASGGARSLDARQAATSSTRCETTHPSGSPGCSHGAATLAGGVSLLVALGLLGVDAVRARRREDSA